MPFLCTRWWTSYSCKAKFQCLYSPKAVSGCFGSMLLWKLKVLTKKITAPWHEGKRLQPGLLASWQQISQLWCLFQKVCPRHGNGGIWGKGMTVWWQHCHDVPFMEGVFSGRWQLSPWAGKDGLINSDQMMQEKGNFQNRGWRFCAFQSHNMSNCSSGKQVFLMSSWIFKLLKDTICIVSFSLVGWNSCLISGSF